MKNKLIQISIVLILILLVGAYFWKALLSNQLEYAISKYFEDSSYHSKTTFVIHDTAEWLNGELVVVEDKQMIGIVYLEKKYGIYKVINHALCNKTDTVKNSFMKDIDYQYRLLRVKSFVEDIDIIISYVKDININSFEFDNGSNQLRFELPENKKLIFSEVQQLFSIIKTQSHGYDNMVIEWQDEKLEELIKYNTNDFIFKSDKHLNIAVAGTFNFKTDDSIFIDNISLNEIHNLDVEKYDALFINSDISNGMFDKKMLDELVMNNWDVFIINPFKNPDLFEDSHIEDNVIIIERSRSGVGNWSKGDYYDLESNYLKAYGHIFDLILSKKQ